MCTLNIGSKKSHNNGSKKNQTRDSKLSHNISPKNGQYIHNINIRANCIQKRRHDVPKSNFLEKYTPGLRFVKQVRKEIFASVILKEIVFHVCDRGDVPKIYPA